MACDVCSKTRVDVAFEVACQLCSTRGSLRAFEGETPFMAGRPQSIAQPEYCLRLPAVESVAI
eukprot:15470603-Alexandrium_andersonii.AAC.1